ncbi:division/cell wall cluster transcriptional repressor MraZ [Arenicella sp. 4NH20-0111]|uniref:division/cell wall cluster transcriptional repressor MraZ n=1 Tax=Arenicella sp. 4NH20-0111 TaxID=3127648 RepID=UPI00310BBD07
MSRGSSHISVDAKGRVSIPTKHRHALSSSEESALVVTISATDRCLLLYTADAWVDVETKLVSLPTLNPQIRKLKRMLIGHADDVAMDSSGRVLLPSALREFANIGKKAVLVGQGDKFEIWDEAQWVAERDSMYEVELDEANLPEELASLAF